MKKYTPQELGEIVRSTRKRLGMTQRRLALLTGTGPRFIHDLENGKPTCELGKALHVIQALGISISLALPDGVDQD